MRRSTFFSCLLVVATTLAQTPLPSDVAPFVTINAPVFVLNHVRVIDGAGTASREDQAVVIVNGKIQSIGPAGALQSAAEALVLDRSGYTVIPGIVGMHDHLFYTASFAVQVGTHGEL